MNTYTTHRSDKIPPIGKSNFEIQNELSERFYALVRTIGGDLTKGIAIYDHSRKKWLISSSGCKEIIEYYTFDINDED